jgi:hypothetical protein
MGVPGTWERWPLGGIVVDGPATEGHVGARTEAEGHGALQSTQKQQSTVRGRRVFVGLVCETMKCILRMWTGSQVGEVSYWTAGSRDSCGSGIAVTGGRSLSELVWCERGPGPPDRDHSDRIRAVHVACLSALW